MIHVAFIVSRLSKGGPINQLYYLCKHLDQRKIRFTIVTTSPRTTPLTYHDEIRALGIEIVELNYGKLSSVLKAGRDIQRLVKEKGVDIVQSFGFRSEFIVSRLTGLAKLTTIRNRPLFNYRNIYDYWTGTVLCYLHMHLVKKFDQVVTCSKTVAENIRQFGIASKVITNAIDFSIFPDASNPANKADFRWKLELPPAESIYITVSSNLPGKNIPFLIDAFMQEEYLQDHMLVVAGFVRKSVLERYSGVTNIRFTGRVSNLFEYFRASDFFISASLSEGMPNAPLEAMALGLPVILSNIEAHLEIVNSVDYPVGGVFKNADHRDLLKQIVTIEQTDYSVLARNCVACIQDQFSASRMSAAYQTLYRQMLS